tara:strand:+ start:182 stop:397 length:216 start_codon:yes stop_codon:yes gene_type:complete
MGKAGISKVMRDRMQNHSAPDVSSKHYDRYDYLPEKKAAMKVWEQWLTNNVIAPGAIDSNVISGVFNRAQL